MHNRLGTQTSPYLKQHADNPVHWQPWDDEALALARREGRPILLSIGYSACHWCHVMAHESFENPQIAALMNQWFVNIKVDREERPDLDKVYQLGHQLITGQPGGWPLTMFLDPDSHVPFFGGTYFPPAARHGLPAFPDLLQRVAEVFRERRGELREQADQVVAVLDGLNADAPPASGLADDELLEQCAGSLESQYDSADGGFGRAPKFPMPGTVDRLLRGWAHGRRSSAADAGARIRQSSRLDMVMTTLTRMARGGIHDHLGGGFCRYATDRRWMIPHFEKMLYDNGQLLALYSDALGVGPDPLFEAAVRGIARWLIVEMRHPDGAFFTALDADSEGEEGKYYLWRRDQVKRLLDADEYLVVETLYGLDKPANFEGRWNLHRYDAWASVVQRLSLDRARADALLASARDKMLAERATRTRPGLDDKVLTGCNALAIRGLATAAVRLGQPDWLQAAREAATFLRERLFQDGRLRASWQGGKARFDAYLDDYAYLLDALLALLAAQWRDEDARFALQLADALLDQFEDTDGGFFFTSHDHARLIHRPKPLQDDAMPPGNAIAARALADLGHLFGETRYLDAANRTIAWARPRVQQTAAAYASMLSALEAVEAPRDLIVIRGPGAALGPWLERATRGYQPWRQVYAIPDDSACRPPYLPKLVSADLSGTVHAYRCEGFQCSLPIRSLEELGAALGD